MDPEQPTDKPSEKGSDAPDADFDSLLRKAAWAPEHPAVRLPRPGEILAGKYRIEERLGQGGMGAVFRATHLVSEKSLAIKWMLRSPSDERAHRRFVREARVTGRIDHPNVVVVYDIGEQPDGGYLVMELLRGETLRARLGREQLGVTEALDLLLPAMRGVSAVHKAGVIHRDLKPDNIFLCRDQEGAPREAKVLDFGISCLLAHEGHDSTLTNEGALLGTPAYMSPEQVKGALDIDARTDVYSFGVILYEMLTGSLPFSAESNLSLMLAITTTQPKNPRELRPDLPPELARIVLHALEKRREQRFASIDSLIAALLPFASAKNADSSQPPLAARPAGLRPTRAVAVSVAASVIVLLALASWLLAKSPSASSDAGAHKPPQPLPFVPFVPQPAYAKTCTSCAAEKCASPHQACVDDPQCRELLRCYGACSDPLCIARCGSYDLLDYSWGGSSGPIVGRRGTESALFSAYQRCVTVYGDCSTDCGAGLDWGCLDKSNRYRWPASVEKSPFHLRLEILFPGNAGVLARVSAYPPMGPGTQSAYLLPRETNGWGQVELEFPVVIDPILQIESNAGMLREFRVLSYSGPFFRDTRLSIDVFPSDLQPVYPHAGFASVIIAVSDCIGAPATGITFELEGASGQLYSYSMMGEFVVGAITDRLAAGGFADVSPANATVTVLAKRDERIVARRRVDLRENWLTSVVLRPLNGDQ